MTRRRREICSRRDAGSR